MPDELHERAQADVDLIIRPQDQHQPILVLLRRNFFFTHAVLDAYGFYLEILFELEQRRALLNHQSNFGFARIEKVLADEADDEQRERSAQKEIDRSESCFVDLHLLRPRAVGGFLGQALRKE